MYWPARAVATMVVAAFVLGAAALAPVVGSAPDAEDTAESTSGWSVPKGSFAIADSGTALTAAQPDIMATPFGFVVGAGPIAWGHTVKVDDPDLVKATGSGPDGDLCVLAPAGFRTFNKGAAPTGDFKTTVYRGEDIVHSDELALAPNSGDEFQSFDLPVRQGLNVISIVVDSGEQVSESDEDNTFTIKIDVAVDCRAAQSARQ
jgi:hypothetical protein